jgi:hypothetical protein
MTVAARNLSLRSHFGADRHPTLSLGTLYFALFNGDPVGAGVEEAGTGGYVRVAKTNDATLWGTLSGSAVQAANTGTAGEILWPAATGLYAQPQLTHWAIFDNSSTGVLWYSGLLTAPLVITGVGDIPRIPAGTFQILQQG